MRTLITLLLLVQPLFAAAHEPDLKHLPQSSSGAFIENAGQLIDQHGKPRKDIDFKLSAKGMSVFVGEGKLHYQWYMVSGAVKRPDYFAVEKGIEHTAPDTIVTYRMDVVLQGANIRAAVIKEEPQAYYENYYLPQCPDGAKAHSFQKITYKNIYPNIDWVLYADHKEKGGLKYDFVVHPGGNVRDIQLRYEGATALTMNDGTLTATTPFGSIIEKAPYSYEQETRKAITSAFLLKGDVLSFNAATHNGTLVIDPEIEWATYYGGSGDEFARCNTVTEHGDIYMAGQTNSNDLTVTTGAFQDTIIGVRDAFLTKFDGGGLLLWATYFGGTEYDEFYTISNDNSGIYASGNTTSQGLSYLGEQSEIDKTYHNQWDVILVKFDHSGARKWCTYFGGENHDEIAEIAVHGADLLIAGHTSSIQNIVKGNVHKTQIGLGSDGFLSKLDTSGKKIWATYVGGPDNYDDLLDVCIGPANELYVSGITKCKEGIATTGAHQTVKTNNDWHPFLAKFNGEGQKIWGTYLGDSSTNFLPKLSCAIALDDNNVYWTGTTSQRKGVATSGAFQSTFSGYCSGFLTRFDSAGKQLWGTYLQVSDTYWASSLISNIIVDRNDDICMIGQSSGISNMITTGAWKTQPQDREGFLTKFDINGNRLWGTYFGGESGEYVTGIAKDASNNLYISGYTLSDTGIARPGTVFQPLKKGYADAFLMKVAPDSIVYLEQPFDDTVICLNSKGAQVRVGYIVSRSFRAGNVFTAELSDVNGSFTSPTIIGTKAGTASGYIHCTLPNNLARTKGYRIRVVASAPYYVSNDNGIDIELKDGSEHPVITGDTALCAGETLSLKATSATTGASFRWAGPDGYNATGTNVTRTGMAVADSGNYIVSVSPFECRTNDTLQVKVFYTPSVPTTSHNAPLCEGDTLVFKYEKDADTTVHYGVGWPNPNANFGDGIITDRATPQHNGKYVVVATKEPCQNMDSTEIEIYPAPRFDISVNSPLKAGQDLKLSVKEDSAVSNYAWTGPDVFSSANRENIIPNVSAFNAGIYYISGTKGGCTGRDSVEVVVNEGEDFLILFPNPNNGQFTLRGNFKNEQEMQLRVVNAAGQLVYKESFKTIRRQVNRSITLPAVASGVYTLHVRYPGASKSIPFTVTR